jgi:hypothetical protein
MQLTDIEKELAELYTTFTDTLLAKLVISKYEIELRIANLRNEQDKVEDKITAFDRQDIKMQEEFYRICNSDRFGDSRAFKAWEEKFGTAERNR